MTAKDRDSQFKRWLAHVRFDKMPTKMPAQQQHMRHLNNSRKSRNQKKMSRC